MIPNYIFDILLLIWLIITTFIKFLSIDDQRIINEIHKSSVRFFEYTFYLNKLYNNNNIQIHNRYLIDTILQSQTPNNIPFPPRKGNNRKQKKNNRKNNKGTKCLISNFESMYLTLFQKKIKREKKLVNKKQNKSNYIWV